MTQALSPVVSECDVFDIGRARVAPGLLRAFNDAGVLTTADVHVARRLAQLGPEAHESVLLAVALAVRAPRLGHVYVDLATIAETAAVETE
jgi:exodeoxyribonuclease V alpha subunit